MKVPKVMHYSYTSDFRCSPRWRHVSKWVLNHVQHVHPNTEYIFTREKKENAQMLRKEDPQQWPLIHVGMYAMLQIHIQNICIYIIYLCVGTKLLAKNKQWWLFSMKKLRWNGKTVNTGRERGPIMDGVKSRHIFLLLIEICHHTAGFI